MVKFNNRLYKRKLQRYKVRQRSSQGPQGQGFRRYRGQQENQPRPRESYSDPYRP